jgi:hypothetical protein
MHLIAVDAICNILAQLGVTMDESMQMPTPDWSGSKGRQNSTDGSQLLSEARPLQGLHVANTLEGLASSNTKAFGGDISAAFIAAATRQLASDCADLKNENARLQGRVENHRDDLEVARIENAVLVEKISSEGRNKHLRNFSITVGTALIGVGVTLSRAGQDGYSVGALVFGCLILALGWIAGPKVQKK